MLTVTAIPKLIKDLIIIIAKCGVSKFQMMNQVAAWKNNWIGTEITAHFPAIHVLKKYILFHIDTSKKCPHTWRAMDITTLRIKIFFHRKSFYRDKSRSVPNLQSCETFSEIVPRSEFLLILADDLRLLNRLWQSLQGNGSLSKNP